MNGPMPERPPRTAPQGEWNRHFADCFDLLVSRAHCDEHGRRIRRLELMLAALTGSGVLYGGYALLRFLT